MQQSDLSLARGPVPEMWPLHLLSQIVPDEEIQIRQNSMKIQITGIYNLCLICPPPGTPAKYYSRFRP